MSHPSKALIDRLRLVPDMIEGILRTNAPAQNQIADVAFVCWAVVDLAVKIQQAVADELGDIDDNV